MISELLQYFLKDDEYLLSVRDGPPRRPEYLHTCKPTFQRIKLNNVVGTDVLDGSPQKLAGSLDGSPRFAGPSIRGTPSTVLTTDARFAVNTVLFVCRYLGPSRTPVTTAMCSFTVHCASNFVSVRVQMDGSGKQLPYNY